MIVHALPSLDTFNRADGAAGANWSNYASAPGTLTISSNQVTSSVADYAVMAWNASTLAQNCAVQVDLPVKDVGFGLALLSDRTADTQDGYELDINDSAGANTWRIYRYDNGVLLHLGGGLTVTSTVNQGSSFRLEKQGNVLRGMQYTSGRWSTAILVTDSTYLTSSFSPGLYINGTTTRCDNFAAGNVSLDPGDGVQIAYRNRRR